MAWPNRIRFLPLEIKSEPLGIESDMWVPLLVERGTVCLPETEIPTVLGILSSRQGGCQIRRAEDLSVLG